MSRSPLPGSRTLLLGTAAPFSATVLEELLALGVEVVGVGVDGGFDPRAILALSASDHRQTLPSLAASHGLPACAVADLTDPGFTAWVDALAPEFILVACFARLLPEELCRRARRDCLNLHPSLLPRYRGPAPLFWQLRAGEPRTGITLHRVTEEVDAGPVVARRGVALADGQDFAALDACMARHGVAAFVDRLRAHPSGALPAQAQDEAQASAQPAPGPGDFRLERAWPARRAFNFMRGTAHWGWPYPVALEDGELRLRAALGFAADAGDTRQVVRDGIRVRVRFGDGVLEATTWEDGGG